MDRAHSTTPEEDGSSPLSSGMDHTYEETVSRLYSLVSNKAVLEAWKRTRRVDKSVTCLREMNTYLDRLGIDPDNLSTIHVAGTKGKGSTCAFTESILRRGYGLRTGLFTSPHLVYPNERIRINGVPLSDEKFVRYFWEVHDTLQATSTPDLGLPPFFRFLTLMGFKAFIEEGVDVAIIEVGLGGRTDATNCLSKPAATGITSLGYDHMEVLGDTIEEIAFEKAGILKKDCPAVCSPQVESALEVVQERALKVGVRCFSLVDTIDSYLPDGMDMPLLGIAGDVQRTNGAMAIELAQHWLSQAYESVCHHGVLSTSPEGQMRVKSALSLYQSHDGSCAPPPMWMALQRTQWAARMHSVRLGDAVMLHIDGAHTPESVKASIRWYKGTTHPNAHKVLLFSCKSNKDPKRLLSPLLCDDEGEDDASHHFNRVILSSHENAPVKSLEAQEGYKDTLHSITRGTCVEDHYASSGVLSLSSSVPGSLEQVMHYASQHPECQIDVLVVGSLYLAGAVLETMIKEGRVPKSILNV